MIFAQVSALDSQLSCIRALNLDVNATDFAALRDFAELSVPPYAKERATCNEKFFFREIHVFLLKNKNRVCRKVRRLANAPPLKARRR